MVHYQWVRVDGWRRAERIGTEVPAIAHRTGNRNRTRPGRARAQQHSAGPAVPWGAVS